MYRVSNKEPVQWLVSMCLKFHVSHIVLSPGSRNAPFIASFSQIPDFVCETIPDERSAGFIALGIAQEIKKPVVLVCTSGSALLNYYPAIAEAYYQKIPIIIISADRPKAWINQGDGQTINQENVFNKHISTFIQLDDYPLHPDQKWNKIGELHKAFIHCLEKNEPIHINVGLNEPLYETELLKEFLFPSSFTYFKTKSECSEETKNELINIWKSSSKKVILCGQMDYSSEMNGILNDISQHSDVLVLTECTSNILGNFTISTLDRFINSLDEKLIKEFVPDLLIYIGEAIVSKKIKVLFRQNCPRFIWRISPNFPLMDTFQHLTHAIDIHPYSILTELNQHQNHKKSYYSEKFLKLNEKIRKNHHRYFIDYQNFCDLSVYQFVFSKINENLTLHLSNSSVVRYAQLFDHQQGIEFRGNRGTSGIDGSTSTAIGAAYANRGKKHLFISGDLSFFYDSNAFWNHLKLPKLKIIVINNGGGNIFKIIEGPSQIPNYENTFVFNNQFSVEQLCKTFGLSYFYANNYSLLDSVWENFISNDVEQTSVLEIDTRNSENENILKNYFKKIQ